MTHLLDVNVLLAGIWEEHPFHRRAFEWLKGKNIAVCPLAELGFIRISTEPKSTFNAPMKQTRELLSKFIAERRARRIPDDLPALESKAKTSNDVTDCYLADLATKHGFKLATLDGKIAHPAAELIT